MLVFLYIHTLFYLIIFNFLQYLVTEVTKKLTHSPETLSENFSTQPSNFISLLHTNYLPRFSQIENISDVADAFCQSDLLSEYRVSKFINLIQFRNNFFFLLILQAADLATIGLHIAIRAVMVFNEQPVTGWMPIKAKSKYKKWKSSYMDDKRRLNIGIHATSVEIALDFRNYVTKIRQIN